MTIGEKPSLIRQLFLSNVRSKNLLAEQKIEPTHAPPATTVYLRTVLASVVVR